MATRNTVVLCAALMAAACLAFPAAAAARDYYVSSTGNDSTGDGSSAKPWATIQKAANAAIAGDSVYVNNGTYAGFHSVNAGRIDAPITFKANGPSVMINSRNSQTTDNVNIENTDYIIIDGFISENSARSGIRVAVTRGVIVRNNICRNNEMWGIFTSFSPEVLIASNTCTGTKVQHGIYVSNSRVADDNPVVYNNECYDNYYNGIQLNGDIFTGTGSDGVLSGARIEKNYVHHNGYKGFSLISMQNSTVINNIAYENGKYGGSAGLQLAEEPGSNKTSDNNLIANNTVIESKIACMRISQGTSNVYFNNLCVGSSGIIDEWGGNTIDTATNLHKTSTTGLFIDPATSNFRLAANSPAIDAGAASYAGRTAPNRDYAGTSRPQGAKFDVGSYEYIQSAPAPQVYTIQGSIRDASGIGVSGVTVQLSGNSSASVITGSDGSYQFTNCAQNGSFTVTPQKTGYTFAPANYSTSALAANISAWNFVATPPATTYAIRGYIRDASGAAISGATVQLSGSKSGSAITNASGFYEFLQCPGNGNFTLTSQKLGYTFTPLSVSISQLAADISDANFVGAYTPSVVTFAIRGYIKDAAGKGIPAATVQLSGTSSGSAVTSDTGFYEFTGCAENGNFTVTPQKTGYTFTPASYTTAALTADLNAWNFTGTTKRAVRGHVKDKSGKGISGATVQLSGDAAATTITDGDGYYEFAGYPDNGSYLLAPQKTGYTFIPQNQSVRLYAADASANDFTGIYSLPASGDNPQPPVSPVAVSAGKIKIVGSAAARGAINPDQGDIARIYFKGTNQGTYECRIFTLSGELVWHDTMANVSDGVFEWPAKNMASGNYLIAVTGPNFSAANKAAILR